MGAGHTGSSLAIIPWIHVCFENVLASGQYSQAFHWDSLSQESTWMNTTNICPRDCSFLCFTTDHRLYQITGQHCQSRVHGPSGWFCIDLFQSIIQGLCIRTLKEPYNFFVLGWAFLYPPPPDNGTYTANSIRRSSVWDSKHQEHPNKGIILNSLKIIIHFLKMTPL